MKIELTRSEFFQASMIGLMRNLTNINQGRKDRFGAEKMDGWGIHIEGACGEAAVAKAMNVFYNGNMGDLTACDVNNSERNIEVRTRAQDWHDLIIHPSDKDDSAYILITGKAPSFTIQGWILGMNGKQQEFWKDPAGGRPAFFVLKSKLRPINELI